MNDNGEGQLRIITQMLERLLAQTAETRDSLNELSIAVAATNVKLDSVLAELRAIRMARDMEEHDLAPGRVIQ